MSADQITAQDKEEIDPDPTESMPAIGKGEAKDTGVVNDDDDDGEGPKEIETGLSLSILKARIDSELSTSSLRPEGRCSFDNRFVNGERAAGSQPFGFFGLRASCSALRASSSDFRLASRSDFSAASRFFAVSGDMMS